MTPSTEQEAVALLNKWVKILELEHWILRFEWCVPPNDMRLKDATGVCTYQTSGRCAIIQMLDPHKVGPDMFYYDYEQTLVHELLHLKLHMFDTDNSVADIVQHQLIDSLAHSFVNAAHGRCDGRE